MTRPGWDDYFLGIATAVSARADCTRSLVGAVIVKDNQIVQPGYNGAPPGMPGCLSAGACPRGRHHPLTVEGVRIDPPVCACGRPHPCPDHVPAGSAYDTGSGTCIAIHAEANAIIRAGRDRCIGATIYVTRKPCDPCFRLILAAGIERVIWPELPEELRH
jgi:dCMP deaminase